MAAWYYGKEGRQKCIECRDVTARMGIAPKCAREHCESSLTTPLHDALRPYFDIFTLCDSQVITGGMGGVYGLNWAVIRAAARDHGIDTDEWFYTLLRAFEGAMCAEVNKR